jgi:hypothetical protein
MSVHELELKLRDAIIERADMEPRERSGISSICEILKSARQSKGITVLQRSIIVLQSTRRRRTPVA